MRKARSIRSLLALLVVVNALGSPMAWANWLGATPSGAVFSSATSDEAAPPCHGHRGDAAAADHGPAGPVHGSAPCCAGGNCACAAPAVFVAALVLPTRIAPAPASVPRDTGPLPSHPLDDTLRPPIR